MSKLDKCYVCLGAPHGYGDPTGYGRHAYRSMADGKRNAARRHGVRAGYVEARYVATYRPA